MNSTRSLALAVLAAVSLGDPAAADEVRGSTDARIEQLEAQLQTIARELDKLRKESVVPEEKPLASVHGLGPAASKVYQKDRGLSIGGYGEMNVRVPVGSDQGDAKNVADFERFVLYAGYKFTDRLLINAELEFEHSGTGGGGSVSLEFATLEFLLRQEANIRAGLVLAPMGFINEIHEPPFRYGNRRPESERRIIPSTWREIGAGFYGQIGDYVQYRMYGMNSFDGTGFDDSGLRGGRQKGSRVKAEDWAFTGRLDVTPLDGLLVGGSLFIGNTGQDQLLTSDATGLSLQVPDALTTLYEFHLQYKRRGATFRGLFTQAFVRDAGELSEVLLASGEIGGRNRSVAKSMLGGYAEFAYDILPLILPETTMSLEPFYRYEYIDTQRDVASGFIRNRNRQENIHVVGLQYKPHPSVVVKTDYTNFDPKVGTRADEWSLGFGFVY
jgi:hypothetical protein